MYSPHGWVKKPADESVRIWRYFKFARFVELLQDSRLYFARLDQFDDAFEGVLPPASVPLAKDGFKHAPRNPGDELTDWEMFVRDVNRTGKLVDFANCWYSNQYESDAMWRLYGPEGVAIQSTFGRLVKSFDDESDPIYIGKVTYLDFLADQPPTYGNTISVAFCKRKEFEHEREVRAVVTKAPAEWKSGSPPYAEHRDAHPKGFKLRVNLERLIEQVVLAPKSSSSFREEVQAALVRFGVCKPIAASHLDDLPALI